MFRISCYMIYILSETGPISNIISTELWNLQMYRSLCLCHGYLTLYIFLVIPLVDLILGTVLFFSFQENYMTSGARVQSTCSRFHPFGIDFILSLWAIGIRYWSTAISDGKKIYIAPGNDLLLYSYMHWLWWQKSDKESIFTYTSVWKQMVYN